MDSDSTFVPAFTLPELMAVVSACHRGTGKARLGARRRLARLER